MDFLSVLAEAMWKFVTFINHRIILIPPVGMSNAAMENGEPSITPKTMGSFVQRVKKVVNAVTPTGFLPARPNGRVTINVLLFKGWTIPGNEIQQID